MDQTNLVTPDDVLAGEKQITVRTRRGEDRLIRLKALSGRRALLANEAISKGMLTEATLICLAEQARPVSGDAFLNEITPAAAGEIARVVIELSNGVDEAKNREAKSGNSGSATSSPPNAG